MELPPIPIPDGTETKAPDMKLVGRIGDAVEKRQNEPFFTVLPRPQYPNCDHKRRGVTLDTVARSVRCNCGAQIDPFDALLIYRDAEQRLIHTKEQIERHKREETEKAQGLKARKPFLREVHGFVSVFRPAPPKGDGALYAYDVRLHPCGHTMRWPSKGRRHPRRHLTCDICLRAHEMKEREQKLLAARVATEPPDA